jgi:L-threonylcarbamoyladenylate synthase
MKVITKGEYAFKREFILKQISEGSLFVYPTDTIYRIGCDATNPEAVKKLRALKNTQVPFSIMAPSKQWIRDNCHVNDEVEEHLDLLPGKYVLVLQLKNKGAVAPLTTQNLGTIGVRIPRNWTQEIATLLGKPIITTAANISGSSFMTSLDNLSSRIKPAVDFCLYDGEVTGQKVTVINLAKKSLA